MLCFASIPDSFSFSPSDKCVLPNKAECKEKIEMQSPSSLLPRNAANLAFRSLAPFIRMPLRNLCRVSVHSFSLMKHQISFTNNSCVRTKHSGPCQRSCHPGQMQCLPGPFPQDSLPSPYPSQSLDPIWLPGETKGIGGFQRRPSVVSTAFDIASWNVMFHKYLFECTGLSWLQLWAQVCSGSPSWGT